MGDGHRSSSVPAEVLLRDDATRVVVAASLDGPPRIAHVGDATSDLLPGDVVDGPPGELSGVLGPDFPDACRACLDDGEERSVLAADADPAVETTLSPVREDGAVRWVVCTVRDVSERERLRADARESGELLDAVLDNVPIHLYVKDENARHVAVSDYYVDGLPFVEDRSEMIGLTDDEAFPGDMGTVSLDDDRRVIEEGDPLLKAESYVPELDMWTLTSKFPWERGGETRGLVGVTIDITRRKQYARELERRNEQLSEFASIISHDLRNPLNTAAGYLDLARESGDPDHFETVAESVRRAREITDGLERLVRASGDVETTTVDVDEVARRAWEDVGSEDGSLRAASGVTVDGDANWIRTLFENLFRNAVEHAGADATVGVTALTEGAGFAVSDDGPGIPPEDREAVFGTDHTTKADGGGVGLWIVARIADAHGWDLDVRESEGGGARFEVHTA